MSEAAQGGPKMQPLLQMFILDVLRHDIECCASILNLLNDDSGTVGWREFWPRDFTLADIMPALESLIVKGWVIPYKFDPAQRELEEDPDEGRGFRERPDDYWFLLSEQGRRRWEQWDDFPTRP